MEQALDLVKELTRRELEVLATLWLNRDRSARELAGILCLSEACVRFHLRNIYHKLGVSGKVDLLFLCNDSSFGGIAAKFAVTELRLGHIPPKPGDRRRGEPPP